MIRFSCPKCGQAMALRDEIAGQMGKCGCGAMVQVPMRSKPSNHNAPPSEIKPNPKNFDWRGFAISLVIALPVWLIYYHKLIAPAPSAPRNDEQVVRATDAQKRLLPAPTNTQDQEQFTFDELAEPKTAKTIEEAFFFPEPSLAGPGQEQLFLLYVIDDLYRQIPLPQSDAATLPTELGRLRVCAKRIQLHVSERHLDRGISDLFSDYLSFLDAYADYLGSIDVMKRGADIKAEQDLAETALEVFAVGSVWSPTTRFTTHIEIGFWLLREESQAGMRSSPTVGCFLLVKTTTTGYLRG